MVFGHIELLLLCSPVDTHSVDMGVCIFHVRNYFGSIFSYILYWMCKVKYNKNLLEKNDIYLIHTPFGPKLIDITASNLSICTIIIYTQSSIFKL